MDAGASKMRVRELPPLPLPPLPQRALPTMSSLDITEARPPRQKKKKLRKEKTNGGNDQEAEAGLEMGGVSRECEVGGQLTPEGSSQAPPPQGRRRKKKKKDATLDLEDDQTDLVNEDAADQTTDGERLVRKPRKKKKTEEAESQLPDGLDVEEDDVLAHTSSPVPQHALFSAPQCHSQPVGKVFVERSKRFQAAERSWRRSSEQTDDTVDFQDLQTRWTTRDVSVQVHQGFRGVGLYCHGFLAGLAVWNVVVVYMLAGDQLTSLSNLLQQYQGLVSPVQSVLYLLLAVSTVAAFDRVNLAKSSVALRELVNLDPVALASFLYFSALLLSLSQQRTSDRMNLFLSSNTTLWPPGSEHQILLPWVTVNLVVALLVSLAWIFIAMRPETDYTSGYLVAMAIDPPKAEDQSELTT